MYVSQKKTRELEFASITGSRKKPTFVCVLLKQHNNG